MPPAPVQIHSHYHLPRVSHKSLLSSNDKGDSEVIPGVVYRYPDICLKAEENLGKLQLGDRLMKAVRPVIIQMRYFINTNLLKLVSM